VAARKPTNELAQVQQLSDAQIKQNQRDQYQRDLQAQITAKRQAKEEEKARRTREDIEEENKIL
jgi:hypothetical protein